MTLELDVNGIIDSDFRCRAENHHSFVFSSEPLIEECADLFDSSSISQAENLWSSPDSTLVYCTEFRRGKGVWIHWRPNERIVPHTVYHHRYSWQSDGYGPDGFYFTLRVNRPVGVINLKFETPLEAVHALSLVLPIWRRKYTQLFFWNLLVAGRARLQAGVPEISENGRTIRVRIENPPLRRTVMLFVLFRGGFDPIESEARREHALRYWIYRRVLRRPPTLEYE